MENTQLQCRIMPLPGWDCDITIIATIDGLYSPIVELCAILGIVDHKKQVARLRDKSATAPYIRQFAVPTKTRGRQLTTCIHQKALGYWLGFINEKQVRPEIRERLIELQQDILEVCFRYVLGDVPGLNTRIGPVKGRIEIPEYEED